jgi:hypothetical protein
MNYNIEIQNLKIADFKQLLATMTAVYKNSPVIFRQKNR